MKKQLILSATLILFISLAALAQTNVYQNEPGSILEVKTGPMSLLSSRVPIKLEYLVNNEWGVEFVAKYGKGNGLINYFGRILQDSLDIDTDNKRAEFSLGIKKYFNPIQGADGFYLSVLSRYRVNKYKENITDRSINKYKFSLGGALGYKWVTTNNIVVETGLGLGRAIYHSVGGVNITAWPFINMDPQFRLDIGYRF